MAFTPSIPESTDLPSQSQSQIKDNFDAINTTISVNHVEMNASGEGKHKFLQMPEQGSAPTTAANEGALYTKQSSYTTEAELFYRKENSGGGGGAEIEMTASSNTDPGWALLPCGLLIKWGISSLISGGLVDITYPTGPTIPVFSSILNVQVSPKNATGGDIDAAVRLATTNTTLIRVYLSKRTTTGVSTANLQISYFSIGLP